MTSHIGRLYALALALFVFFLTWATVAARPWATHASTSTDPRAAALAAREARVRHESIVVARVVRRRWAIYRRQLAKRQKQIAAVNRANAAAARQAQLAVAAAPSYSGSAAAAPSVRVVSLPPVTITRTS